MEEHGHLNKESNKDKHGGEVDRDHGLKVSVLSFSFETVCQLWFWYMSQLYPNLKQTIITRHLIKVGTEANQVEYGGWDKDI